MAGIRKVFAKFIVFGDGPTGAVMVNNADWLDELRYIPLLREVGRYFSVNRMLTQDSIRLRLEREQPLSFLEFNYPICRPTTLSSSGGAFVAKCRSAVLTSGATLSAASNSGGGWTGALSTG